jgi:pyruvate,water dikinase
MPAREVGQATASLPWLGGPDTKDPAVVGGKAAALSRLAACFPVPPGFCVPAGVPAAAAVDAYAALAARLGADDPPVAVRSSACDEDGAAASFAGQHATLLHVSGAEAVRDAVTAVAASAASEPAVAYRRHHGLAPAPGAVPVLVQALVVADVALVAFTADPVTGARDRVVINASWGLGESIVGGTVTPDSFTVAGDRIVARDIADKRRMTVACAGGTREVDVPAFLRRAPSLSDDQLVATADLARAVERHAGHPVDVEAAWAGDSLHLLQCRPITTLG